MLYDRLTLLVFRAHFHAAQLNGFLPFTFTGRFEQFHGSRWLTVWSHAIAVTLICIYPVVYYNLMLAIPYPTLFLVHHLVWVQCALHYLTIFFAYRQLLPSRLIIRNVFNSLAYLARTHDNGQQWLLKRTKKNITKHVFKIMLVDTMVCLLFSFYFGQFYTSENPLLDKYWLLNIFSIWQSAILTNVIVSVLNLCSHFYAMLNRSIRQYVQHTRTTEYGKLTKLTEFEVFSTIRQNHHLVTSNVKTITRLLDLPMLCLLLVQFTIMISEVCIDWNAEKTGVLLNEFLPTDPNVRVERCIESFTIELLHQDFKISNCGLYNVDYTLMFSMIATITSYLIMLVQFQLAEI
uniref:Gustatory receptor n=1 Tax=Anopheles dirus TaxID=7168 RepID=A0A182NQX3_9DIPT